MSSNQKKIIAEYNKYIDAQVQFVIFVKKSPELFIEISHAIVDLVETLERIDYDLFTTNQRTMLREVRALFKTYLIKNS